MSDPKTTIRYDYLADPAAAVEAAASTLADGGIVAIPTETVYGLAADAHDMSAVDAVFEAKQRPLSDPLIVHVPDAASAGALVQDWTEPAAVLAAQFWPGPLTLVLARSSAVEPRLSAGLDTVAVRVPAHPAAEAVLRRVGVPLAAPSANRFGRVSPTDADHVAAELDGRIDGILDAGPTPLGVESTIVDLTGAVPRVLRPGGITLEMLTDVLGEVAFTARSAVDEGVAATAPGQLLAHYAPDTPVVLVEGAVGTESDLAGALSGHGLTAEVLELADDPDAAARELYRVLRSLDSAGVDVALVRPVRPDGLGRAVNDRLFRAAHGRLVNDATPGSLQRIVELLTAQDPGNQRSNSG